MKKTFTSLASYFLSVRWYVVFSLGLFFLFFLVGFAFPVFFRVEIIELLQTLIGTFEGKTMLEMMVLIFWNNLKTSFFAMILGIFFGIFPLIIGIMNGYITGFVSREAVMIEGPGVLVRLIPHGIFELPAVFLSMGIGLRLGMVSFRKKRNLKRELINALRFFVFVIIPLLLIAAIIEGILLGPL